MSIIQAEMKRRFQQRKDNTVTSVELVDIINTFRKEEGKAELRHNDFMAKIRKELETLNSLGLGGQRNFSQSSYINSQNKEQPCFKLTHDGMLEMLNSESAYCRYKTIEYINNLQAQIEQPKQPTCIEDLIIMQAESMKNIKQQLSIANNNALQAKKEVQGIRDVVAINTSTISWREDCRKIIVRIAQKLGGNSYIGDVNKEVYGLMRTRLKVRLDVKLTNLRRRMADEGVSKSRRDKMNYLDVIKDDSRLVEGYVAIVKELAVKYGADVKEAI